MLKYLLSTAGLKIGTIDFTDNIEHRQLLAQLKHLIVKKKERYWLTDEAPFSQ